MNQVKLRNTTLTSNESTVQVRGRNFLVLVHTERLIGDLVLPEDSRESFFKGTVYAFGDEVNGEGIEPFHSEALFNSDRCRCVGVDNNDSSYRYYLVRDEDVVMIINPDNK